MAASNGILTINSEVLNRDHRANLESGRVEITEYLVLGEDTTVLWSAAPEIADYTTDMNEHLLQRRWFLQVSGQAEAPPTGEFGTLTFDLPFRIPDWMRRIGIDHPRLTINGSYKLVTEGTRRSGSGVPHSSSWFPSLTLDQQPAFVVRGSIGRLISVEINSEEGFGNNMQDQLKLSYRGEGDELEDDIIQEIEVGNTSLSLTGTELTGYTEEHSGLFGMKMRMKIGNLEITTIASQEGSSQERQSFGAGTEPREFPLEDRAIDFFRHFWLTLSDREEYGNPANWDGSGPLYVDGERAREPVEVFRLLTAGEEPTLTDSAQACAYNESEEPTVCVSGRWQTMEEGEEFTYDEELRLLSIPGGHRDATFAVRWEGDPIQSEPDAPPRRDPTRKILIHSRSHRDHPDLDPLMWRNVYSIGPVAQEDRDNFRLDLVDNEGRERASGDSITYVRRLGLERREERGVLNIDDRHIFKLSQGYLVLPCLSSGVVDGDPENCLTPMKRVRPEISLYETTVDEVQSGPTASRFIVFGRQRQSSFDVRENTLAASGQQCYDINPDTERITLNGSTRLQRGLDYEVIYETGQISLLSARARDPNAEIEISYECDPPFQVEDKVFLGTRMEYQLDNLSDQSLIGATVLFKSQTTSEQQPELGHEPFNHLLMGMNTRLDGQPLWMTRFANMFPFVHTEARSRANLEFEIAHSLYNPNTRDNAYVDNFDFSENETSSPMHIYDWTKASPPLFGNDGRPDPALDHRHQGRLVWHSSFTLQYAQIYGNTGNSFTNSREQNILRLQFQPNDNLLGNSWGGIMRAFPQGLSNHSRKRTLDVVVQGREGSLHIDLGRVSEDIGIPGVNQGEPDGALQSEVDERSGDFVNRRDAGLDGVLTGEGETGGRWECKPACYWIPNPPDFPDPGTDDWCDPTSGATDEPACVNGTEDNNQGSQGVAYDTEDINRNGVLDTLSRYMRYTMPLDSACTEQFHCEELRNGWRRYRIPLYGAGDRIDPSNTETEQTLLANGQFLRMWIGNLPPRTARTNVQIARVNIVGNNWEEGQRNTGYEIPENVFGSGDLDTNFIRVPPSVRDSNNLRVDVINRQEDRGYVQSPNTPREHDSRTGEPLPERALVLRYENLHPGEEAQATRILSGDAKDFTRYDRLSLEVHGDSAAVPEGIYNHQGRVSLGLQLGRDQGNRESSDYYEIRIPMDTTAELDPEHRQLWERNSFTVRLSDLTGLKNDPLYRAFAGREISRSAWHDGRRDSSLTLSVTGDPNLGSIDWMRLVIYVDSGAVERQKGEIWINDLRLEGVDRSSGTAIRSRFQLEFADFINVSGNLQYTNGNFTTMSETRATPANSVTNVDYNTNISLFANKFFPDDWGVKIPLTMQFRGALDRHFTRPFSDLRLEGTGLFDIARDLFDGRLSSIHNPEDSLRDIENRNARVYQDMTSEERFSASYSKEMRSESFLTRTLLERPSMEYRFAGTERTEFYRESESRDYKYRMAYNLSPKNAPLFTPLEELGFIPEALSRIEFAPVPERVNLVVADYSFVRSHTLNKPRDEFEPVQTLPADYTVELSHGFDLEWRLFSFLNLGYRIDVNRDFDQDRECFGAGNFFGGGCGGLMASGLIFAWDDADRGAGGYITPGGEFVDTTRLGDRYGILARERNRSQSFHVDFTANPLSWLSTGAGFNSGYRHTWVNTQQAGFGGGVRPGHFEANADHEVRLTGGINPGQLFSSIGSFDAMSSPAGTARSWLDRYRVRNVDVTYIVSNRYNSETFTYNHLARKGVTATSLLAYQFGFVYGLDNLGTIFNGVPDPTFFDYLSEPDPALGQSGMNHVINRSVDVMNGFSVPPISLDLTGNLKYSKQYSLYRAFRSSDTTIIWPEYTLTGNFNDFAEKIPLLRNSLRSLTAYTNYNYREESRFSVFSSSADMDRFSHRLAPLIRFTGTTNQDVRIELSFNAAYETEIQYGKVPGEPRQPVTWLGELQPPLPVYERDPERESPKRTLALGVEPTITWEAQTEKGIQFWRYYVRLKNNLRFTLNCAANYMRTEVEQAGTTFRERDEINANVQPEVTYNFTNNVDARFRATYQYEQYFHTPENEYIHEVGLLGEFTMRF